MRFASLMMAIAGPSTAFAIGAVAAPADDASCRLEPAAPQPICSPNGMLAAINPGYTPDVFGNLNLAAFADGANRDLLPGQARLRIEGGVSAGGAACARHLAAVPADNDSGPAFTPAIAAQIKKFTGETVETDDELERHVVFQLFSPNIQTWESGGLGDWYSAEHDGVGGWPPNSAAMLTIELTGTRPADLKAGGTYDASVSNRQAATAGPLFTRWQGRMRTFAYRGGEEDRRQIEQCRNDRRDALRLLENLGLPLDASAGRAIRDRDCSVRDGGRLQGGQPYLVGNTQQAIEPELDGTVTIRHITADRIFGSFVLSGDAEIHETAYQLCYTNRAGHGCLRDGAGVANGTARVRPGTDPERKPIRISGNFQAPNTRSQGFTSPPLRAVTATPDGTTSREPLEVVSHTPRRDRRNVDWEAPGIAVRFSAPVNPATLTARSFFVYYRDETGTRQRVAGQFAGAGANQARFVPDEPLKDGVRYRVALTPAVKGRDGQPLAGDYEWPFHTMVDLDDDETIGFLPDILQREEGIEAHVFQVSRDAMLVPGKPTLTRVYTKWRLRDDVYVEDQVRDFEAHVRIKDAQDQLVYPPMARQLIRRPDDYTDDEIMHARNTVNLFTGWRARSRRPPALIAEVEPVDQCGAPRVFTSAPRPVQYANRAPVLDVDVYFFQRAWAEDLYQGRVGRMQQALVNSVGPRIAQYGAQFTTQNFPVVETRMHFKGPVSASLGFAARQQGDVQQSNPIFTEGTLDPRLVDEVAIGQIRDQIAANGGTPADAVMVLFPADVRSLGGYTYDKHPDTGLFSVFVDPDSAQYFEKSVATVAHELGHVYGLSHSPRKPQGPGLEADALGVPPIEGFRIAPGGTSGWNKSEEEGNAQSNSGAGSMLALMGVGQFPVDGTFISQASYDKLLPRLTMAERSIDWRRRIHLAARGDALPAIGAWHVTGVLRPDGSAVAIDRVAAVTRPAAANAPTGAFRAVLRDARGNELAARRFHAPERASWDERDADAPRVFSVALPPVAAPAELVIEHTGQTRARRRHTEHAPTIQLADAQQTADRSILAWQADDADDDRLRFDVEYSPDGERFQPLALGLDASELRLPTAALYPGAAPTVRVTATDGFNRTRATRRLKRSAGLAVLTHGPDGDEAALRPEVYARFNAPLAAGAAESAEFVLVDADDSPIEATVRYHAATRQLSLRPEQPLNPGQHYEARLTGARDAHGHTLAEPLTWPITADSANRP